MKPVTRFLFFAIFLLILFTLPICWPTPIGNLESETAQLILIRIRLPMLLTALFAGGVLAGGGLAFQALFRNPLATPYTLGISSGAAFGAVTWLVLKGGGPSGFTLPIAAFAGALLSTGAVMVFTARKRHLSSNVVLLAGVAVNFLFSSIIMFLQYLAGEYEVFRVTRWLLGGLSGADMVAVSFTGFGCILMLIVLMRIAPALDLVLLGDDLAITRGLDLRHFKKMVILLVSIAVAATIAFTGPIGFVGIIVPHMVRLQRPDRHRSMIPMTMAAGGLLLAVCDTIGRTILYPVTVPTGVLTAMVGAPFFLWLLARLPNGPHR